MVNKVLIPADDSLDVVRQTIAERVKHREFYDLIEADLLEHVANYISVGGDPSKLDSFVVGKYTGDSAEAEARKKSLVGLYSPNKDKCPYQELERLRKNNGLVICPSCGELGRPRTLDHYLPKKSFPELSFTLVNLTPMCDWCQGEKGIEYIQGGEKIYLHPYYDDVDRPLVRLRFSPPYETPVIEITTVEGLNEAFSELVMRHLEGIDFHSRYKEYFKTAYLSVLRAANSCRKEGGQAVKACLEMLLTIERGKGVNSWDAILYRSVLADESLMDFLEGGLLPDYL